MNKHKRKINEAHAKMANRVAGEVSNLRHDRRYTKEERRGILERYRARKFSSTFQAAQTLRQARMAKRAQVGRALVWAQHVEYPCSLERQTLFRIEGYLYDNKMVIMNLLD